MLLSTPPPSSPLQRPSLRGCVHSGLLPAHRLNTTVLEGLRLPGRGGSRIFQKGRGGGVHLRSTSKKGGSRRGSKFGPNVKKPTQWAKRGGRTPHPPRIRPCQLRTKLHSLLYQAWWDFFYPTLFFFPDGVHLKTMVDVKM